MCICWPLCLTSFLILYLHFLKQKSPFSKVTGAQPEIFKGRGGFLELGHFNKPFVKNKREKGPVGKNLGFFCLDTVILKLHYEWKIWPKDEHNQGLFSKVRAIFSIFKKDRGGLPSSPSSSAPK